MSLAELHLTLGWVVIFSNAIVGSWALAAHWVKQARHKSLWIATAATQIVVWLQVIVGVINMTTNDIEVSGLHLFYGFLALFFIAILYSYRQQVKRWQYLLYGFGGLFLMGLAIRAMLIPSTL